MRTRNIVVLGLLTAIAGILHVVESWLPLPLPVPGVKLGLANVVSLFALTAFGLRGAFYVTILRGLLGALLSGTLAGPAFAMSIGGGLISVCFMAIAYQYWHPPFSLIGISMIGATAHSTAQVFIASIAVSSMGLLWYVPYVILFAVPTGILTGFTTVFFLSKMPEGKSGGMS
jgi:heptaprenyl diphosphate synthase